VQETITAIIGTPKNMADIIVAAGNVINGTGTRSNQREFDLIYPFNFFHSS